MNKEDEDKLRKQALKDIELDIERLQDIVADATVVALIGATIVLAGMRFTCFSRKGSPGLRRRFGA